MFYDSRGNPVEIRSDPGLVCFYCKYDNTPGPASDGAPDCCEGCGARL